MTDFDIDKLPIKPTGRVIKAKEALIKLFNENQNSFEPVFEAVKNKFNY